MATSEGGGSRGKNRMVAALLALFLGPYGVHHYYLGSVTAGIVELVLCLAVCGIMSFVEAIMLFMMSDEDFDRKYNQRAPDGMEFVWTKK